MRYDYNIVHVPGKELIIADTLSRAPRVSTDGGDLEQEVDAYMNLILETLPATKRRLQEIKTQLETDPVLQQVMSYCRDGWPDYISQTPGSVQPYWNDRAELTVQDGLLLKNSRIVIPSCMRLEILYKIHTGHQGIVKCRERAKNSVWWPGLSKQLEDIMRTCMICVQELSNHADPLITTPLSDRPCQKPNPDIIGQKEISYKDRMKASLHRCRGTRNLSSLDISDHVYVPNTAKSAVIVNRVGPRSYNIQISCYYYYTLPVITISVFL